MKLASKYIKAIIESSNDIKTKVGTRIFPIAATAGTDKFPFIAFEHSSIDLNGTKDGRSRRIDASISAISKTALEAEEITDMVMPAIEAWAASSASEATTWAKFDIPEFVKETEIYAHEIDAFISTINITFEYNS